MTQSANVADSLFRAHPRRTARDAHDYVHLLREKFGGESHVYQSFLGVMQDFKAKRIDAQGVLTHLKSILQGHDDLIAGLAIFLPEDIAKTVCNSCRPQPMERKCPMCWQQFTVPFQPRCCHVFCRACIGNAMKTGAACPLCWVPWWIESILNQPPLAATEVVSEEETRRGNEIVSHHVGISPETSSSSVADT